METDNFRDRHYLYVVEGITDEDKLKKLGCLYVLPTGGKYIRKDIMEFLKEADKVRPLALVLDPDGPGRQIEELLKKELKNISVVHADKRECIKKNKVGIAQMHMDDLKDIMKPYITHDLMSDDIPSFDDEDIIDLNITGADSKANKEKLIDKYHIPFKSSKKIIESLLILNVSKREIEEVINNG